MVAYFYNNAHQYPNIILSNQIEIYKRGEINGTEDNRDRFS